MNLLINQFIIKTLISIGLLIGVSTLMLFLNDSTNQKFSIEYPFELYQTCGCEKEPEQFSTFDLYLLIISYTLYLLISSIIILNFKKKT